MFPEFKKCTLYTDERTTTTDNTSSRSPAGSISAELQMRAALEAVKEWDIERSMSESKPDGGLFTLPLELRRQIEAALGN